MKLYQLILVAVISTTVLYGSVAAEYQDDRLFGNGRFLRRLRNDAAKTKAKPKADAKSSKKAKADPRAKSPTPAGKRPTGRVPTPAVRSNKTPTPAVRPNTPARPTSGRYKVPITRPPATRSPAVSNSKNKKTTKPSVAKRSGFGMQLDIKSDQVTVTKVDSRGNAAEAGVKKGDVVLEAGGAEIGSLEEFNEIAKILGQGDQLEFKVVRRGKKQDILIQFGETPEVEEVAKTSEPKKENDYRFVPKRDDNSQTAWQSLSKSSKQNANLTPKQLSRNRQSNEPGTIERQRQQIEQMQKEIERLKGRTQVKPANPVRIAPAKTSLDLDAPSILEPKN